MTMPSSLRLKQPNNQLNEQKLPSSLKPKKQQQFPTPEEEEREYDRAQAQLTSRGLESFVGVPGDIASFLTGLFGKEQNLLPTSKKLREFSEKASLGYTKPKNEFEEKMGELASDVGSMAFPGGGQYKFARNIGIPVIGSLAKEGLGYLNASEKGKAYGKTGTMIFLDLISRRSGGIKAYVGSLFKKAEESIPKGVSINATGLQKSLDSLEKTLSAGGSRPTTKKSLEKLGEIRKEIQNGKIDAKRLAAYRPAINEAITELGGFQAEIPAKLKPQTIENLNKVKREVIKTLDQYGEKFNPEYLNYSRPANEAYAALQKSNTIANFIQKKTGYVPKSKAVQDLFSYGPTIAAAVGTALNPVAAAGSLGVLGAYQGFKVLHRMKNSPTLRKYYIETLKNAVKRNAPQTIKNLRQLDKLSLDQEQKEQTNKQPKTLRKKEL
jgi:hypothetical protein